MPERERWEGNDEFNTMIERSTMFRIRVWAPALACALAISFTICVLGGLLIPNFPIPHESLELFYPGFRWLSPGSFVLGLAESLLFGAYAALVFVPLHNVFMRRAQPNG